MAMELDDPGCHHSVPADFRTRPIEGGRADRLLDLALARLKEAGLASVSAPRSAPIPPTSGRVRDLTRLDLITETVRVAPEEVTGTPPHLLDELADEDWGSATAGRSAARQDLRDEPGAAGVGVVDAGGRTGEDFELDAAAPASGWTPCSVMIAGLGDAVVQPVAHVPQLPHLPVEPVAFGREQLQQFR